MQQSFASTCSALLCSITLRCPCRWVSDWLTYWMGWDILDHWMHTVSGALLPWTLKCIYSILIVLAHRTTWCILIMLARQTTWSYIQCKKTVHSLSLCKTSFFPEEALRALPAGGVSVAIACSGSMDSMEWSWGQASMWLVGHQLL